MNTIQLLTVVFAGIAAILMGPTLFFAVASWRNARPRLEAQWGQPDVSYRQDNKGSRFTLMAPVLIGNPSPQPDSVQTGTFKIHKPRLNQMTATFDDIHSLMSHGDSLRVGMTGKFTCEISLWNPQKWAGENVEITISIRTLHQTLSSRVAFTVPPIPASSE